ncbi:MAG: hypothetical protein ACR2NZ_20985 [Rubripirellula sp.]
MDLTRQRRYLNLTAAGFLALTGGVAAWSFSRIDDTEAVAQSNRRNQSEVATTGTSRTDPSAQQVAAQSLRGPLYDPPPPPPPRPQPPPRVEPTKPKAVPKLDVTLVGTIIEADQSMAIIADATGKFDIKGVGEPLELTPKGMIVGNIESEQVTLKFEGRESTVKLERGKKIKSSGGARGNKGRRNNR